MKSRFKENRWLERDYHGRLYLLEIIQTARGWLKSSVVDFVKVYAYLRLFSLSLDKLWTSRLDKKPEIVAYKAN